MNAGATMNVSGGTTAPGPQEGNPMSKANAARDAKFAAVHEAAVQAASAAAIAHGAAKYVAQDAVTGYVYDQPFEAEGGGSAIVPGNSAFGKWLLRESGAENFRGQSHPGSLGSAASFGYGWAGTWRAVTVWAPSEYAPGVRVQTPGRGYERSRVWVEAYAAHVNEAGVLTGKQVASTRTYID